MADTLDQALQRLRIVLVGLMGGLGAFGAVALVLGPLSKEPDPALAPLLLGGLGLLCVGDAIAYRVLRGQTVQRLRARSAELRASADPSEQVLPEYQKLFIVRGGLTEGPGFFSLIVYLLTGNPLALVVTAGALLLLLSQMPSRERVRELAEAATSGS
jgi:hypothetical protein